MMKLNKPIVVIGMARAGTTVLSGLINWHSQVGPKLKEMEKCVSCQEFIDKLYGISRMHTLYSGFLEHKSWFFGYFPGGQHWLHMGNELICEDFPMSTRAKNILLEGVTRHLKDEPRFLCKSPSLTFIGSLLPKIFGKDVKIVCITRDFKGVDESWRRIAPEGFKRRDKLMGISHTKKIWNETKEYIKRLKDDLDVDMYNITYEDLVAQPDITMEGVLLYCELPIEPYIYDIKLRRRKK